MSTFTLKGTCAFCKGRFKVDANEVLKLKKIFCPCCGEELDKVKIQTYAKGVLGEIEKNQ